jgi:hypothetical protein
MNTGGSTTMTTNHTPEGVAQPRPHTPAGGAQPTAGEGPFPGFPPQPDDNLALVYGFRMEDPPRELVESWLREAEGDGEGWKTAIAVCLVLLLLGRVLLPW